MSLLSLVLFITALFASEFIPSEYAPPPNTRPKDVPPPLTELAEREGMSQHKAKTEKLDRDVLAIQDKDKVQAAGIVSGVKDLLKKTAAKAITTNKRKSLEAQKVVNDASNTAFAGVYLEDKIKKVKASEKKAIGDLDVVRAEADAKVVQAQKDVIAKNEVIQSKNTEIDGLNARLKEEADRQEGICQEKLEAQSKSKDEQMAQAIQLKQNEVQGANDAKAKAEEAVEEAKRKCGEDMDNQKTANDNALASKDSQMESLKQDIKNKEEVINQKDEERAQAVTEAQQQCDREKTEVREQAKNQCDVQVQKVDDSLKDSQREVEDLNQKIIDVEARVTKEKDTAVAELSGQLDSMKQACVEEVRQAKKATSDEGDKRLAAQKLADREKLKAQQALTKKCLSDSNVNMANKEQQCRSQRDTLRQELAELTDNLAKRKSRYRILQNKLEMLQQTVKDQTEQAQKAAQAADSAMKLAPVDVKDATLQSLLEEEVATPVNTQLRISSAALAVYSSLILSALFLCGLIYKLRGHLVKHKNYSAVLADA